MRGFLWRSNEKHDSRQLFSRRDRDRWFGPVVWDRDGRCVRADRRKATFPGRKKVETTQHDFSHHDLAIRKIVTNCMSLSMKSKVALDRYLGGVPIFLLNFVARLLGHL